MITLPLEKTTSALKSPRKLVLYSPPKTGKTTLVSQLEDCLLLDLEDGSDFVNAMKIKAGSYQEIHEICEFNTPKMELKCVLEKLFFVLSY